MITFDSLCHMCVPKVQRKYQGASSKYLLKLSLVGALALTSLHAASWNVQSFGAKGDGTTDDSTAIQSAINACSSGDTVLFPAGNYIVSRTLTLRSNCNYTGQNGATLSGYTGTGAGGFSIFQNGDYAGGNMTISGLVFNGGGIFFPDTGGTMSNVHITNCTFQNFLNSSTAFGPSQNGIFSGGGVLLSNSTIDYNTFKTFGGPTDMSTAFNDSWKGAMFIYSMSDLTISNNTFDLIAGNAMSFPTSSTLPHPNLKILNNTFTRIHRMAIEVQILNLSNTIISGNRISLPYVPYSFGISFAAGGGLGDPTTATGAVIQNNVVDFTQMAAGNMGEWATCYELQGISLRFDSNFCMNGPGNTGTGAFANGVVVAGPDDAISNNTFCGPFRYGILTYEPPYPDQQGHPAILTNNSLLSSCANVGGGAPDLTISSSHSGSFSQGGTGAYTLSVSNVGGAATNGSVTVNDRAPAGLTPASASGSGWSCSISGQTVTCSTTATVAANSAFPPITLTVNVASNAPQTVTNSAAVSGGGESNTANDTATDPTSIASQGSPTPGAAPVSDDFTGATMNSAVWTFVNPLGDASYSLTGSQLVLNVPGGANHDPADGGVNRSVRVVQTIGNGDFSVQAKFDSIPTAQYQFEGMIVEQDASNYLRFQVGSTGSSLIVNNSQIVAGSEIPLLSSTIALPQGTASFWLRVQRAGTTWTQSWSADGNNFTNIGAFNQYLVAGRLGVFAGNYGSTTGGAPAFTAKVDYFYNMTPSGAAPDLTVKGSHTGSFVNGQTGAHYSIAVNNVGGAPTTGQIKVTDTLPTGLTPTGATGSGWSCSVSGQVVTCTTSAVIAGSASAPTITVSVNVSLSAPATATNTVQVAGGGETNAGNDTSSDPTAIVSGPRSDDFVASSLNSSLWTVVSPGNGVVSVSGSRLLLAVPAGSNHDPADGGANNSVRVIQTVKNGDFGAVVKFDSIPQQQYQFEGLLVEQDAANYLRFQFGSTGSTLIVNASKILSRVETPLSSSVIQLPSGTQSLWLQVQRTGDTWTQSWSTDGSTFTALPSFTQALNVVDLGPFAGNYGSTPSAAPAFTALVDYVFNTAQPLR
jgi:uncharacterized repeat protein (TIGR01451 family)